MRNKLLATKTLKDWNMNPLYYQYKKAQKSLIDDLMNVLVVFCNYIFSSK